MQRAPGWAGISGCLWHRREAGACSGSCTGRFVQWDISPLSRPLNVSRVAPKKLVFLRARHLLHLEQHQGIIVSSLFEVSLSSQPGLPLTQGDDALCAAKPCERRVDVLIKGTTSPLRTRDSICCLTCFLQRGRWRTWRKGLTDGTHTDTSGGITGIHLLWIAVYWFTYSSTENTTCKKHS